MAELFSHNFPPAYKKALQHFKNEIDAEAVVTRISPHGIFLDLFEGGMQAKLPVEKGTDPGVKAGDTLLVKITHLTNMRVVVKRVESAE